MNLKKEKEMFEEWYEKHHNGRQISCDYVYEDNSYSIGYANAMWISWKASSNREGYKLVPVEPSDRMKCAVRDFDPDIEDYANMFSGDWENLCSDIYKAMIGACDK